MPHHRRRRRRVGTPAATDRGRREQEAGYLRLGSAAADEAPHVEGRGPLRSLRPVRRALSHRRLGHAEVRASPTLRRTIAVLQPAKVVRTNDFAFKLANVNGTGSASANGLLMQAIFRMGIPVSGKNLFPSNIQVLPTWYEIRVNAGGYTARALDYDLMVAMNSQTYARDIHEVRQGGYLLYDSTWPLDNALLRDDVTFLGVPFAALCNENFSGSRDRVLMKNIAYAGTLVAVLNVDVNLVAALLDEKYASKKALRDSNHRALRLGYDY